MLKIQDTHIKNFKHTKNTRSIEVETRTLDSFIDEILPDEQTLLKIDTQGAEWEVILGAKETLIQVKYLLCEVSFVELYEGQKLFDDIYSELKKAGFVYKGSIKNIYSPISGEILQSDAVFIKQ